jgi:hypothetical protein
MASRSKSQEATYWISYSDLSTGLLLVFILLVAYFINQAAKTELALQADQDKIESIQEEIEALLGRRDELASRLQLASQQTNAQLGRDVFAFDPETQQVVVQTDDEEVAWFRQGSSRLTQQAREDVTTFYIALYEKIMCVRDLQNPTPNPCSTHPPRVPEFLDAIEILGHSDPLGRGPGQPRWSWAAFNGTPGTGYGSDSNLDLAQARSKSIVDAIQERYSHDALLNEATYPWRPFLALVKTSGRGWMSAYCDDEGEDRKLTPADFLQDPPCQPSATPAEARRLEARSRRVSFGFRLDDKEILERLQRLTREVAGLGVQKP